MALSQNRDPRFVCVAYLGPGTCELHRDCWVCRFYRKKKRLDWFIGGVHIRIEVGYRAAFGENVRDHE
jgi:hypothetical protein